jgi:hypothetical protein
MELFLGAIVGLVFAGFLGVVAIIARAGSLDQLGWALTVAAKAKHDAGFTNRINELLGLPSVPVSSSPLATTSTTSAPKSEPQRTPAKPSVAPLRLLSLLQTESRLVDFLLEDIASFKDDQVGQAVRDIHRKAQGVLKQYLVLEPVVSGGEGESVLVPAGFDPSAIRVLGNVTGQPPYRGEVQHPGWRVRELKLQPTVGDENVLQPAEVQLT